jgi:hypothetical protein
LNYPNRRVRVTASARWKGSFGNEAVHFDTEMAAPVEIEDPKRHRSGKLTKRVRMEAGRSGVGSGEKSLRQQGGLISPFPFPLRGKPGRAGSPHAAKNAAPPTRGAPPPCASPRKKSAGYLTGDGLLMEAARASKPFAIREWISESEYLGGCRDSDCIGSPC